MKLGPRYKIARRYGAELFEKTSTQKFALREGNRDGKKRGARNQSDFARQLAEKQKARFLYGLGGRQIRRAARTANLKRGAAADALFNTLEMRLDNAVFRAGFASTRRAARQTVSHGHVLVNGRRTTIPSRLLIVGDVLSIRPQSVTKKLWPEHTEERPIPTWISYNHTERTVTVVGTPKLERRELPFTIDAVLEFYRR